MKKFVKYNRNLLFIIKLFNAGQKIHMCNACVKSFSRSEHLKIHISEVHEYWKGYKYCNKLFTQAGDLKKHIHTVHEGHKYYQCKYCQKIVAWRIIETTFQNHVSDQTFPTKNVNIFALPSVWTQNDIIKLQASRSTTV